MRGIKGCIGVIWGYKGEKRGKGERGEKGNKGGCVPVLFLTVGEANRILLAVCLPFACTICTKRTRRKPAAPLLL